MRAARLAACYVAYAAACVAVGLVVGQLLRRALDGGPPAAAPPSQRDLDDTVAEWVRAAREEYRHGVG